MRINAFFIVLMALVNTCGVRAQDFSTIPRDLFEQQCEQLELADHARAVAEVHYTQYIEDMAALQQEQRLMSQWIMTMPSEQTAGPYPETFKDGSEPLGYLTSRAYSRLDKAARRGITAIEATYFDAMQTLSGAADARMAILARDWRRARLLPRIGANLGGKIDLIDIVQTSLPEAVRNADVHQALDIWAERIDDLFDAYDTSRQSRNEEYSRLIDAARQGADTFDEAAEILMGSWRVLVDIADVTERSMYQIAGLLDPADAATLEQQWLESKWDFVWYRGREDARISRALERKDLSPEQKQALQSLQDEINQLRMRSTPRLERLWRAVYDVDAMVAYQADALRWNIARERQGPAPEWTAYDDLNTACKDFIHEIESLGSRIDAIFQGEETP
ncbi:MAG: hypothetical protein ACR2GY_06255 [Phycisphaerales bacterium]